MDFIQRISINSRFVFSFITNALSGKKIQLIEGNINQSIMYLALPSVLELIMESLFVCSSLFYVSRLGANSITVVGTVESIIAFTFSVGTGLSIAGSAIVARRIGAGKIKDASLAGMQILYLSMIAGLVLSTVCFFTSGYILNFMGLSKSLVVMGQDYTHWMFASIGFLIVRISMNGVLRGSGKAVYAMRALWLSNSIYILLCPVMAFGFLKIPALGLTGIAVACLLSRIVGVIYQLCQIFMGRTPLSFSGPSKGIDLFLMKKILKIAFGAMAQYLIPSSNWAFMIRIVSLLGTTSLASYIIAQRISSIATMPAWGIGNAAGVLTGMNLGACKKDRAEKTVWRCGFFNMAFLSIISICWLLWGRNVVGFFSQNPVIVTQATLYVHLISVAYLLLGFTMVISRALNAAGEIKSVTLLYVVMFYGIQIPMAYLLGIRASMGYKGIFAAILSSELFLSIACIYIFRRGTWKEKII